MFVRRFCMIDSPLWVVKSRRMRWAEDVTRMGKGRGVHRVLVWKPEGKRSLGRPTRRWEDNIKMDLQEVGGGCGDWMELAQDRDRWRALVGTVRNLRVPKMWGISWLAAEPVSFSRRTLLHEVRLSSLPFRLKSVFRYKPTNHKKPSVYSNIKYPLNTLKAQWLL